MHQNQGKIEMVSLDADELIAEARSRTGLRDFGETDFRDALDSVLKSMSSEAKMTTAGASYQRDSAIHYLSQHLRMEEYFKRYPEIDAQEVVAPLFVLGLARSGTTKLSRVIASDPQWNVVLYWDGMSPVPLEDGLSPEEDRERRIAICRRTIELAVGVGMSAAHLNGPFEPEEDSVTLMAQTFMTPPAWLYTPSHHRWCETADYVPCFRFMRRLLKFLQWIRGAAPGRRWILKNPFYLDTLPALTTVFPDAKLVWTHRHPKTTVASLLRIVEIAHAQYSDDIDRLALGRQWMHNLSRMTGRAMQFRQDHPDIPFLDVDFRDTVSDSLGVVSRIYAFANAPVTEETVRSVAKWEEDNPQGKHGEYTYALEDYGITEAEVETAFRSYIDRYVT